MKKGLCLILLFLHFSFFSHAQTPVFITDSLDNYIKKGMADWQIPGLAIAIVKDGQVIVSKGYGVREIGKPEAVDGNTLFMFASNTKLFTATSLAKLDEEKKLSLDDRVTKYLPDFALYDSVASQIVTIRDLLSHRLGTKNFQGDFLFWDTDLTRRDVVQRMRLFIPPYPFRQEFGYSNSGFVVASEVIPKVTGTSWEKYVETNLLKPLGMQNTWMVTSGLENKPNVARPYTTCCNATGNLLSLPFDNLDNLGPATGMVSCVNDMARWLIMQLDSGRLNGKPILPWSVLEKTRTANTIVSSERMTLFPLGFQFYCLGIGLLDYAGFSVFAHAGGATGYRSNTTFVPKKNLGIVILTNQDNNNFYEALRFQILDAYLNVPFTNRNQYYLKRAIGRNHKNRGEIKALDNRVDHYTKPVLPLSAYAGKYRNSLYGTLSIFVDTAEKKQNLKVTFEHHPNLTAQLSYMDNNEFRISFSNPRFGVAPVVFTIANNRVEHLELKGMDFVDNDSYIFTKQKQQ